MPIASLNGVDAAGGALIAGRQGFVRCNGVLFILLGDRVAPHGTGVHNNATVGTASAIARINGIGIARQGDAATCGHACSGSSNLNIAR